MTRTVRILSLAAAVWAAPAATAAAAPAALPTVQRALAAQGTAPSPCATATRAGTGVAATTYRAPMSGFASIRLAGGGDWDLAVRDLGRRGLVGSSQGFGGREVVQTWVQAGQRLRLLACRGKGAAGAAKATVDLLDVAPPKRQPRAQLVRVSGSHEKIEALEEAGLDVTHNRHADYADVVVAGDAHRSVIAKLGLRSVLRLTDLDAHTRRTAKADARAAAAGASALPSGRQTYRTYEEIQAEMKAIAAEHADIAKPVVIGRSYQGRELSGIEFASDVHATDGRPTYLLVALHHAREWPSAEAAMEFMWMMAKEGRTDPRLKAILDNGRTVVVPLINPDGYITSRSHADYDPALVIRDNLTGGEEVSIPSPIGNLNLSLLESIAPPGGLLTYRRKNCAGGVPDPNFPCDLQWGVDPNRNYGEGWGGPGSSPDPTSQGYHGPGPWSEPETQAVHEFSARRHVTTIITLHNVAALVLRPPGTHFAGKAPDEERMKQVGDAMAEATGYESQYGFQLYDTTGTTEDWNYAATGAYGYTIEIGPKDGEFHMPYQVGVIDEWTGKASGKGGLREALVIGAETAANASDHSVLEGTAPAGATLRLRKQFTTRTSEFCTFGLEVPLLNPAFIEEALGMPAEVCPEGRQGPLEVPDGLDTSTTVPASGAFEWHVNPSTRPFVGATRSEEQTAEQPTRTKEVASQGGTSDSELAGTPLGGDGPSHEDIPLGTNLGRVRVAVDIAVPLDDYDVQLLRREGDQLVEVASSGNQPGMDEALDATGLTPGEYVLRVNDYLTPADGGWTAKIEEFDARTVTVAGTKEAWTLTCERDGQVLEQRDVVVDRGQRLRLDLACGAPQGAAAPDVAAGGAAKAPDAKVVSKGKATKKKALTKTQKRKLARCLTKARKVRGAKKRRAAQVRCYKAAGRKAPAARKRKR